MDQLDQVAVSVDGAPKKRVHQGDIVINSRSDRKGSAGISPRSGSVSIINTVLIPERIDSRFAHHLIRSTGFQEEFYRFGSGIVADLWSTRWSAMKNISLPTPPATEQKRIADYLDHETAEIDAFINDQTTFSELLSERDITTMALVRDSTSHSAPLRRFGSITLGKMVPSTRAGEAALSGLIMQPYLRAASVQPQGLLVLDENIKEMPFTPTESRNLTLHRNDVVVVEGGAGFGRSAVLDRDLPGWGFQNSINRIRLFPNAADPYFIHYNLQLMLALSELDIVVNQATIPHLTAEKLASCPIAHRPLEQQKQISGAIRSELDRNNALRADIQASIALARERRAALITAAVTGQIDVTARNKPAAEQLEDDIAQGLHREN
ncbi:restriction endonuclease subunit S [Kocuria varians]|uniref:restriction endonuclease subunit S n=1 Tax=Kocuria varians TaxID=1272 RepID=UPI0018D38CAE|nr:restriction endonuclease subunit S [Kocuria varians]